MPALTYGKRGAERKFQEKPGYKTECRAVT